MYVYLASLSWIKWVTVLYFPRYEDALQRHNTENSKQILPGKELRGYSPNSYIHVSLSDLHVYILLIGLFILLQENRWAKRGNIQIAHTRHTKVEIGTEDVQSFLGIHNSKFLCSVVLFARMSLQQDSMYLFERKRNKPARFCCRLSWLQFPYPSLSRILTFLYSRSSLILSKLTVGGLKIVAKLRWKQKSVGLL